VLKLQILSSSSSALGSTFYPLDPLSDIGRTILEFDAIGLAAGEKFHRALCEHDQRLETPAVERNVLDEDALNQGADCPRLGA